MKWDQRKLYDEGFFNIKSVIFNSILVKAFEDLSRIAEILGEDADKVKFQEWAQKTRDAMNKYMWDEEAGLYRSIDVSRNLDTPGARSVEEGKWVEVDTGEAFMPLWAGIPTFKQVEKLLLNLFDPNKFWTPYPLPSVSIDETVFKKDQYWRGPSWGVINSMLAEGLSKYSPTIATLIKIESLMEVELGGGIYENWDPYTGDAVGHRKFPWFGAWILNNLIQLEGSSQ